MAGVFKNVVNLLSLSVLAVLNSSGPLLAQSLSSVVNGITASPTQISPQSAHLNPALIGYCRHTQIEGSMNLMWGWMRYQRTGRDPNTGGRYGSSDTNSLGPVPSISICSDFGSEKFRFGYNSYFPSGVMANFDAKGSQRYDLISGLIIPWHHQFTIAYQPSSEWSFGLSAIYSVAFLESELEVDLSEFMRSVINAEDMPAEHASLAARAQIPFSTSHSYGLGAGIHWWPTYQWSFGLSFFAPVAYEFDSELILRTPSLVQNMGSSLRALGGEGDIENSVRAKSTLPAYIVAGVRYQPFGYWTGDYFGRYSFNSWNRTLSLTVKNSPVASLRDYSRDGAPLNDSWMIGTVQTFNLWREWSFGLTAIYATSAIDDHMLSVSQADFDSTTVGVFTQYKFLDRWTIGAEYAHHFYGNRSATNTYEAKASLSKSDILKPISSDGAYRASANRLGVNLRYDF